MYKCPYCNHTLETKNLRQGLYGRCSYCRFAGYIPKTTLQEPYKQVKTETEEVKTETEEVKPLKCCAKYKTERGLRRHWEEVLNESAIHPIIWEKHKKAYNWNDL